MKDSFIRCQLSRIYPLLLLQFVCPVFLIEQCGGHIIGSFGKFTSPNYPKNYGDNLNCTWIIKAPQYYIIELKFQHFDLENGYDSVEIFDGEVSKSKSLNKYSGNSKPGLIVSKGNKLSVVLLSDQLYSGTGFEAQYKTSKLEFIHFD